MLPILKAAWDGRSWPRLWAVDDVYESHPPVNPCEICSRSLLVREFDRTALRMLTSTPYASVG